MWHRLRLTLPPSHSHQFYTHHTFLTATSKHKWVWERERWECESVRVCGCEGVRVWGCESVRVYERESVQVRECASLKEHKGSANRLIHMYDMTHSYLWHDSFTRVMRIIYMCDIHFSYVRHASCIHETWLIHMCDMTHSHVWHDTFTCVTWHIHMCDMTHPYVYTWTFLVNRSQRQKKRSNVCDMTHSYVRLFDSSIRHESFIYHIWLIHMRDMIHPYVTHNHMSDIIHTYVWHY